MYGQKRRILCLPLLTACLFAVQSGAQARDLSLADAVDMALAANTGLRITRQGEHTADAALKQARGRNGVSVSASDSVRWSKTNGETQQSSNGLNLSASLPLYTGGANQASIQSGEIGAAAARLTTERAREDLKYEVTAAYYNAVEALKKTEVQRESVGNYDAHLGNVTALYEAGAQARIDVLRSSVELSNARQELISAENAYEVNLATLRNLLNMDRGEELHLTTDVSYVPFEKTVQDCISYAYGNRRDLQVQKDTLAQRELAVDIAKAGKKPTVNLTVGSGITTQFRPHNDTNRDVSASVGVNWNIFDSGVTRAQIDAAEAERDTALLNVRQAEETIDLNLRKAYLNLREAEKRFTATGDAVKQAEEDYFIASRRYSAGEGILLDVLDAQLALSKAKQNDINARYDYARYRAQVENLMGEPLTEAERVAADGLPEVTQDERDSVNAVNLATSAAVQMTIAKNEVIGK